MQIVDESRDEQGLSGSG